LSPRELRIVHTDSTGATQIVFGFAAIDFVDYPFQVGAFVFCPTTLFWLFFHGVPCFKKWWRGCCRIPTTRRTLRCFFRVPFPTSMFLLKLILKDTRLALVPWMLDFNTTSTELGTMTLILVIDLTVTMTTNHLLHNRFLLDVSTGASRQDRHDCDNDNRTNQQQQFVADEPKCFHYAAFCKDSGINVLS
jgi:hypothetical protein